MTKQYQHWQLEINDRIAYLTLNRPKEKNRIGRLTLSELKEITQSISKHSDVWTLVLQANGDCFSGGRGC